MGDSFPENLLVWNNHLWFSATNEVHGYELWKFDGQTAALAADILPGPLSSYPLFLAGFGREVCLSANDSPFDDWELWAVRPLSLQITAIEHLGPDIRLTWQTEGGTTNVVQSANSPDDPFETLSPPLIIPGASEIETNYVIPNTIPGSTSRFYRILRP